MKKSVLNVAVFAAAVIGTAGFFCLRHNKISGNEGGLYEKF